MERRSSENPLADVSPSGRLPHAERRDAVEGAIEDARREEARREDERRAALARRRARLEQSPSAGLDARSVRAMLSSPLAVRRAIILADILGPPKALRPDD